MARILRLPTTPGGRALLRDVIRSIKSADTRQFVTEAFDWDESAVEDERLHTAECGREVQ